MTDPKIAVPQASLSKASRGLLETVAQSIFEDGYLKGYAKAEGDAIARIIQAVRPSTNGQVAANEGEEAGKADKAPGAATHKLIVTVLRGVSSGKATPTEIAASPANKNGIARDAIRNALRRGKPSGRYLSDGKGRYSLGKAEAQK
ncbi:MAG: hypothetical protein WB760_23245 [Xanthobacteraceae bacterium]